MTDEMVTLLRYLDAQRECVLEILDGLDDTALRTPVTASGWTPIGMIRHLCGAERYWFQGVLTGSITTQAPWQETPDAPPDPFVTHLPAAEVIDFYRKQGALANRNLAGFDIDARPLGEPIPGHEEYAADVRSVILHMIEETARHAGHLDIAREQLDGTTGLGER